MASFRTPLKIEQLDMVTNEGRPVFKLLEALEYEVGKEGSGFVVVVPAGALTDFASVPRFLWWVFPLWWLFPPSGQYNKAAVIHDDLYRKQWKRVVADAIFLDAMECLGVPWYVRWPMYLGVRVGGRLPHDNSNT